MKIDDLHSILMEKTYDDLLRAALLMKHVPDEKLMKYDGLAAEFEGMRHQGGANDLRELWGKRLNGLNWLLKHVPHDEFITAHIPPPESNDGLEMRAETMRDLASKAEGLEHFFALCEECAREYDCLRAKRFGSQKN